MNKNTARVNLVDIAQIPAVASAVLNLTTDEGLNTVKNFISAGKKFSEAVVRSRSSGKKFIRTMGLLVNIQKDTDQITNTDLTKQRTMALCHMILHNSGKCNDFNSPLVGRINFNEKNPRTGIRSLIGAGFQFLGKMVISSYTEENYRDAVLLFHLGCMVLDYIRKTSPIYDQASKENFDPEIDPKRMNFEDYILEDAAGTGNVFIAGCRNLDQSTLSILSEHAEEYYLLATKVHVGRFGGSIGDRVAKNFCSIANEMRQVVKRMEME